MWNLDCSHAAETTGGHSFEISGQLLLAAATVRAIGLIEPMILVRKALRGRADRLTLLDPGEATSLFIMLFLFNSRSSLSCFSVN